MRNELGVSGTSSTRRARASSTHGPYCEELGPYVPGSDVTVTGVRLPVPPTRGALALGEGRQRRLPVRAEDLRVAGQPVRHTAG